MSAGESIDPGAQACADAATVEAGVRVEWNGAHRTFPAGTTVLAALRDAGLADRGGVAVAIGDAVLPRSAWGARSLLEGDRLLVVQATQGG